MYGLVDCNNFYATCEQVFNPAFKNRPLVVLSSNDGCAVARSKEAKELGIPMGAPAFKYKDLFLKHDVIALSSNFPLYGDMSRRVIDTLKTFSLPLEVYSIDEAFIELPKENPLHFAKKIREKIKRWTGITVSVGVASTKTQAKIANQRAKKESSGVVLFHPDLLKSLPIGEIWGIGRRLAKRLYSYRIRSADQLIKQDDHWIRKKLSVHGLRTLLELRGTPCTGLEIGSPERKSIVSSRSFGKEIATFEEMSQAIASFVENAARKLRKEKLKAYFLVIFIETSRFHPPFYSRSKSIHLPIASAYTPELTEKAISALKTIYNEGLCYKRGGVLLSELVSENEGQYDFFSKDEEKTQLIKTFDAINRKFDHKVLSFASEGVSKKWKSLSAKCSPRYTTSWSDIPKIKVKKPR